MSISHHREPPKPRDGDYITLRGHDDEQQREDAEQQLARNGCRFVRFVVLDDGRLQAHGYLRGQ